MTAAAAHNLRPYQAAAHAATLRALWRNPVLVLPTGGGKTLTATHVIRSLAGRTLWVAHRRELIHQAAGHLRRLGLDVGIIMAGADAVAGAAGLFDPAAPPPVDVKCYVASIQTLNRRRLPPDTQLIVVDECHHATSDSYADLFTLGVPVVGLTATPFRLDGETLGGLFGEVVVGAYPDQLIRDGYLVAPRVFAGAGPDLHGVDVVAGDYNKRQLDNRINQPVLVGDIVQTWLRHRGDTAAFRTVCYASSIEHSKRIVARLAEAGVRAEHLDGTTPADERDGILARLAAGETEVVSNYGILTEGWDLPALECAIIARPTASACLHLQMVGRVLRPADGKAGAVVLDHAGNHHRHGPVTRRLDYSLTGPVKVAREQPAGALGMRHCGQCMLLVDVREPACPACGASMAAARAFEPRSRDGELVEFDETSHGYRAAAWDAIRREQAEAGYSDGWARHRFNERFGAWPLTADTGDGPRLVDPARATMAEKQAVYEDLLALARSRGFREGFASHKYREVFGCWPTGFVRRVRDGDVAAEVERRLRREAI